jgi:hypothetical protein
MVEEGGELGTMLLVHALEYKSCISRLCADTRYFLFVYEAPMIIQGMGNFSRDRSHRTMTWRREGSGRCRLLFIDVKIVKHGVLARDNKSMVQVDFKVQFSASSNRTRQIGCFYL